MPLKAAAWGNCAHWYGCHRRFCRAAHTHTHTYRVTGEWAGKFLESDESLWASNFSSRHRQDGQLDTWDWPQARQHHQTHSFRSHIWIQIYLHSTQALCCIAEGDRRIHHWVITAIDLTTWRCEANPMEWLVSAPQAVWSLIGRLMWVCLPDTLVQITNVHITTFTTTCPFDVNSLFRFFLFPPKNVIFFSLNCLFSLIDFFFFFIYWHYANFAV